MLPSSESCREIHRRNTNSILSTSVTISICTRDYSLCICDSLAAPGSNLKRLINRDVRRAPRNSVPLISRVRIPRSPRSYLRPFSSSPAASKSGPKKKRNYYHVSTLLSYTFRKPRRNTTVTSYRKLSGSRDATPQ